MVVLAGSAAASVGLTVTVMSQIRRRRGVVHASYDPILFLAREGLETIALRGVFVGSNERSSGSE
ncbi:hypothetical protein GCM10010431_80940 [Streptomyces kunmingensis]